MQDDGNAAKYFSGDDNVYKKSDKDFIFYLSDTECHNLYDIAAAKLKYSLNTFAPHYKYLDSHDPKVGRDAFDSAIKELIEAVKGEIKG